MYLGRRVFSARMELFLPTSFSYLEQKTFPCNTAMPDVINEYMSLSHPLRTGQIGTCESILEKNLSYEFIQGCEPENKTYMHSSAACFLY